MLSYVMFNAGLLGCQESQEVPPELAQRLAKLHRHVGDEKNDQQADPFNHRAQHPLQMHVGANLLHAGGRAFALIEVHYLVRVYKAINHDSSRALPGGQGNVADEHGRVCAHQLLPRLDLRLTEKPHLLFEAMER